MSALVSLKAATKSFKSVMAFSDVSLTINQGESIALVGPNGSGKTTLLRCIVGMLAFDNAAEQEVMGEHAPIGIATRKKLFYVPDEDSLIDDLTAREYFGLVADSYDQPASSIDRAIETLGHLDFDVSKLDSTIRTFSHGMRKKVQLATLFIPDVAFILIDEPTNGLDPTAIILLKEQLAKLSSPKRTLLLSTHNLAFAEQLAERVLLMKSALLYDGTVGDLYKETHVHSLEEAYAKVVMKHTKN